jgi:hypothetical protein
VRGRRRTRGQALVEFALVLPIFLAMLLGIVDLGRVIWANNALAGAAREAARFAIVHGGSASTACPVGPPGADTQIPMPSPTCPYPSPSKQAIKDLARGYALAGGSNIVVSVCYGEGCSGDTDAADATNARGTPITVRITSQIRLTTPALLGMTSFGVAASSTMVVNH